MIGITDGLATGTRDGPTPPAYARSRWLFLRLLGLVYLIAFLSLGVQVSGLVGAHGILPAGTFLDQVHAAYGGAAYRLFPTLCWFGAGDGMLRGLCWGGVILALLLIAGVGQAPMLLFLWLAYLSVSVAGQVFLWFQWDGLLLETGLVALVYAPTTLRPGLAREPEPSAVARWLVWWLLFRLMFLSGVTKLASGDAAWRDLTALDYHFWTQPLPPWTAWYVQQAPEWLHRGMTLAILATELVVPWLIFVPERWRRARYAGCALLVLGQLGIALTGNYGFFNLLALVLCVSLLDDRVLDRVLERVLPRGAALRGPQVPQPRWAVYVIRSVAPLFLILSLLTFAREIAQTIPGARGAFDTPLLRAVAPLRSVNGYGLFRVMTTERPEIAIEGSADSVQWREYGFRWKPGDPARRPAFVAPHMPRLDWQMWFAALDPDGAREWLVPLLEHLLRGTPEVVALLGSNPFPERAPRYVRLAYYHYRFSTPAERSRTGAWWERQFLGYLTPALSLGRGS